jgi:hypothetical protein
MAVGFGIAALLSAVIGLFVPFYGIWASAIAIGLAVAAALTGDKTFATATPLVAGIGTFFFSPMFWFTMSKTKDEAVFVGIIFVFLTAPFIAMLLRSRGADLIVSSGGKVQSGKGTSTNLKNFQNQGIIILYGLLFVAVLFFVPEFRESLYQQGAIVSSFLMAHLTFFEAFAALGTLAILFVVFGETFGKVGAIVCIGVVGYLCIHEFNLERRFFKTETDSTHDAIPTRQMNAEYHKNSWVEGDRNRQSIQN